MKKSLFAGLTVMMMCVLAGCGANGDGWRLVWEDNFDRDGVIDEEVWSKIPRGRADWSNYMSDDESLYDVSDGNLILRGIVNPDLQRDSVPYLTGGVRTWKKKAFSRGKLEIRAKLEAAKGAWPAFWLLPFEDGFGWPEGGEIDIMERLNHDSVVYQTIHSNYTVRLNMKDEPPYFTTAAIDVDDYNIYGVEMYADSLVFSINGCRTFAYPRIETDLEGQFPFDRPYFLMLDMQIEGAWVGKADPDELPVAMYIDWVRFYEKR